MMSTWTLSVCHGPYGMGTAHASHFLHMNCTAWQRRMRLIFLHVAVYVTMVTLFHQSIDNTVLISEILRKPSSK